MEEVRKFVEELNSFEFKAATKSNWLHWNKVKESLIDYVYRYSWGWNRIEFEKAMEEIFKVKKFDWVEYQELTNKNESNKV